MKMLTKSAWLSLAALLLSLPAALIIIVSVLKYVFNINGPFDSLQPTLENLGISKPLGWNINLLILFGPLTGGLLAILQVLHIKWTFTKEHFEFNISIRKKWFPLFVTAFCISLLAVMFLYMLGENCSC